MQQQKKIESNEKSLTKKSKLNPTEKSFLDKQKKKGALQRFIMNPNTKSQNNSNTVL